VNHPFGGLVLVTRIIARPLSLIVSPDLSTTGLYSVKFVLRFLPSSEDIPNIFYQCLLFLESQISVISVRVFHFFISDYFYHQAELSSGNSQGN